MCLPSDKRTLEDVRGKITLSDGFVEIKNTRVKRVVEWSRKRL